MTHIRASQEKKGSKDVPSTGPMELLVVLVRALPVVESERLPSASRALDQDLREMLGLRWEDVDFDNGELSIGWQIQRISRQLLHPADQDGNLRRGTAARAHLRNSTA